uniref:DUF1746 domain-containing protein n=1 Tax=Syphacia muris TaxID=451379 RepID=A0A0N5B037_9BILA
MNPTKYSYFQSLKAYRNKLDHRLGYCIPACLITIATILILFGFFHQGIHDELSNYITRIRSKLVEALPPTTTPLSTTLVGQSSTTSMAENTITASLLFMFAQLLYLIKPLLISSLYYPEIVQKLLSKQPPYTILINLQQPCLPRIMDSLLPPYAIVLVIVVDILPFLFAAFVYAWDAYIKDNALCQQARRRIEANYQSRFVPRLRSDIFTKTTKI